MMCQHGCEATDVLMSRPEVCLASIVCPGAVSASADIVAVQVDVTTEFAHIPQMPGRLAVWPCELARQSTDPLASLASLAYYAQAHGLAEPLA